MEAVVPGPDGANRLYTCTGAASVSIGTVAAIQQQMQTWIFLVGPTLTRSQFYRAVATASVSNWNVVLDHPPPLCFQISINSVEADWDDESGKVEVRVQIHRDTRLSAKKFSTLWPPSHGTIGQRRAE